MGGTNDFYIFSYSNSNVNIFCEVDVDMANLEVMYSSKSDEWATPQSFFDEINKEFNFNLDPCCTEENHKCENYFTIADNGLEQNWGGIEFFAIHLIQKLVNGLKKLLEKQGTITHWWLC